MLRRLLAASVLCAIAAGPTQAMVRMEQVYPARAAANETERAILFTGEDRQTIDQFFRRHITPSARNVAKAARKPLLIRERLPQDARTRPLPDALDDRLPPLSTGYARVIVGRDVLLLERRSHTILDIVREVVR
jgi:hypothetical protein